MIEVFIEKGYLIESRAKSVFELRVGSFQVKDVLMLLGKLLGEVYECLLICLLVGKGVFLDEMKPSVRTLTYNSAVGDLPQCYVLP